MSWAFVFQNHGLNVKNGFGFLINTRANFGGATIGKAANLTVQHPYDAPQTGDFPQQQPR